jgi:hypothetical protein
MGAISFYKCIAINVLFITVFQKKLPLQSFEVGETMVYFGYITGFITFQISLQSPYSLLLANAHKRITFSFESENANSSKFFME